MDDALRPHSDYACAYIDDRVCFSVAWHDHMSLKLSKCKFAKSEVKFIGHVVGSGTRSPVLDKVLTIKAIPEPHNKKLLRGLLGMLNFYRMYIPRFSELALPLTELTKNSYPNKVTFNDFQRKAFVSLKEKLCKVTKLYAIDFNKCFHLFTDTSDRAVGGALTHVLQEDGTYLPVAFCSAKFTGSQVNWSVIEKEAV